MEGILRAGGIPLMLPLVCDKEDLKQINRICNGYLFTGGQDVSPCLYGEIQETFCGPTNKERDELEKRVFDLAWESDRALLGICRGIQFLNVIMGGTLYQDLSAQFQGSAEIDHHMNAPYDRVCHQVSLPDKTPLNQI